MTAPPRGPSVESAIVDALVEGGVDTVLGMPGGMTLKLWNAVAEHPGIRAVVVREESIGAYMAEAHGRLTGRPAAVMGQGEWIVGNAGQAAMEALLGSSPMIILTEMSDGGEYAHHAPYQGGSGDPGTWDARGALAAVTKSVLVSRYPSQAVQHTQQAIKLALSGDPGPVAVVYSADSLRGPMSAAGGPRLHPTSTYLPGTRPRPADAQALREAVSALAAATAPVIVAGNGVRTGRAQRELRALAEEAGLPVATTSGGKGVFPEDHELAAGVIGPFGSDLANLAVGGSDVILAVGTKLGSSDTAEAHPELVDPARQRIVHVDVEPANVGWTLPVDVAVIGDAAHVLPDLLASYDGSGRHEGAARLERLRTTIPAVDWPATVVGGRLSPHDVVVQIARSIPPDTAVSCDAGENRLFMLKWFTTRAGGEYLQPAAGGGMGYAVPAAMASALVRPGSPALAVCGDGGFSMSLHALMSAVERSLPVVVVVLNNNALGWVLHGSRGAAEVAESAPFDFAAIARAIGCDGHAVTDVQQLDQHLGSIAGLTRPLVLDVAISRDVTFRDLLHRFGSRRNETGGY
ncbi:acetolactate synthase large subunit [Nocardioides hungaricus]